MIEYRNIIPVPFMPEKNSVMVNDSYGLVHFFCPYFLIKTYDTGKIFH